MKTNMKMVMYATVMFIVVAGWLLEYSKVSSLEKESNELKQKVLDMQNQTQNCLTSQKYEKMMLRGWEKLGTAWKNEGHANSDYDYASYYYKENYYSLCSSFADSCDIFYGYAYGEYNDAKALFEEAKKYAATDETSTLAELHANLADYGAKYTNELHQECEYFSSACDSYDKDLWSIGDGAIERMNGHVEEHDRLVLIFNDYWSKINAALEGF